MQTVEIMVPVFISAFVLRSSFGLIEFETEVLVK